MTAHEISCELAAQSMMCRPGGAATLADNGRVLMTNQLPAGYRAAFASGAIVNGVPRYGQVWAFSEIHRRLRIGELALVEVRVGMTPHRDIMREENAGALEQIEPPVVARLDSEQNCADDDGDVWWTGPLEATSYRDGEPFAITVPAVESKFPLEVGASKPSVALNHLDMYGAVARWPYGFDRLWILVGLPTPVGYAMAIAEEIDARVGPCL